MISANDARDRARKSTASVNRFLEILGSEIEKLADQGKFEYEYTGGRMQDPVSISQLIAAPHASLPVPEFWKLVKEALERAPYNYRVHIAKSAPYVPSGLGSSGEDDPQVNLIMRISWA